MMTTMGVHHNARTELCHDSLPADDGEVFFGCNDSLRPICMCVMLLNPDDA